MGTAAHATAQTSKAATLSLLIVDDEAATRSLGAEVAAQAGLEVRSSETTEKALETLEQFPVDIVVTDLKVPQLGGIGLLKRLRANFPQIAVLVLTQYGTIETAVEATRLGALD